MSLSLPIVYNIAVRTVMEFIEKCITTTPDIRNQLTDAQIISLLKSIEESKLRELYRQTDKHRCMVLSTLLTKDEFKTLNDKHEAQKQQESDQSSGSTKRIRSLQ